LLYGIVIAISLEGSLAGQFVKEAQTLTEGAPAGKVMQCVTHYEPAPRPRLPEPGEDASPPPYQLPPMSFCHREPVDSERWTKPMDATLFNFWLMARCSAQLWFSDPSVYSSSRLTADAGYLQKETHE
jgi:hypothetical protein